MKDRKKTAWYVLFVSLIAAILCLSACNNESLTGEKPVDEGPVDEAATDEKKDSNTEQQESEQPQPVSEPAEIIFYPANGDSEEAFNNMFGDAIREKFPHFTISFISRGEGTTIPELVTTGTRFDMTYAGIASYEINTIPYGLQYDMTELLKKQNVDLSSFEPTMMEAIAQMNGGKIYSLPVYGNNLILYYNKDVFDRFGQEYPRDGMFWSETMDLARRLTREDEGVLYKGFGMIGHLMVRFSPLGIPMADLETHAPTINTDDRWMLFFQTFFIDPQPSPGTVPSIPSHHAFFNEQSLAMFAYISGLITIYEQQFSEINWDMVALPSFEDMPGMGSQINSTNFGITSIAENKDAAAEVLAFLVSKEFQMQLSKKGTMPVLIDEDVRNALGEESVFSDLNFQSIFYNDPMPVPPKGLYDMDLISLYAKYGTKLWTGEVEDINTARRLAEEEAKQLIEDHLQTFGEHVIQ